MCDFVFDIKKNRVKSILALYPVFLAFATPIKFYFDVFFKLLPYVALAFCRLPIFFAIFYFTLSTRSINSEITFEAVFLPQEMRHHVSVSKDSLDSLY